MNRKALIIYCGNTPNASIITGPAKDAKVFYEFLKSSIGGSWKEEGEIMVLHDPTIKRLTDEKDGFLADADYALIFFSGHGGIDSDNNQYICLNDGNFLITDLPAKCPKQTIIIDACSSYAKIVENYDQATALINESTFASIHTVNVFKQIIRQCPAGITYMLSSSPGQTSSGANTVGHYTLSLIRSAQDWGKRHPASQYLNTEEATENTREYLINKLQNTSQTPRVINPLTNFPFAVGIGAIS